MSVQKMNETQPLSLKEDSQRVVSAHQSLSDPNAKPFHLYVARGLLTINLCLTDKKSNSETRISTFSVYWKVYLGVLLQGY